MSNGPAPSPVPMAAGPGTRHVNEQGMIGRCPTCGKPVNYRLRRDNPSFPFCSDRCKLIDLGKWLDEEHRIVEPVAGAPVEPEGQDEGDGE